MKKIYLYGRRIYAMVDDGDHNWLSQYRWSLSTKGYAQATINGRTVFMHRLIAGTPTGLETDHIDHRKLNNQRSNLRWVTAGENQRNRSASKRNTSGRKGVCWHKQRQKWYAQIQINGRKKSLGLYDNREDAAQAYTAYSNQIDSH